MLGLNQRNCSPMGSGGGRGRGRVRASIVFTSITSLPNPPPSPLLVPPYEHEYDSWIPLQECLSSYHGWTYLASFLNEFLCIVIGHCKCYFLAWRRHGKSCTLYGRSTLSWHCWQICQLQMCQVPAASQSSSKSWGNMWIIHQGECLSFLTTKVLFQHTNPKEQLAFEFSL